LPSMVTGWCPGVAVAASQHLAGADDISVCSGQDLAANTLSASRAAGCAAGDLLEAGAGVCVMAALWHRAGRTRLMTSRSSGDVHLTPIHGSQGLRCRTGRWACLGARFMTTFSSFPFALFAGQQ
jgi:hypothetical protein